MAFFSFFGFTVIQSSVAFVAKSEAMMGDSAAMAVDALTYGFNLYAERKKNQDNERERSAEEIEIEIELSENVGFENGTTHDNRCQAERAQLNRHLYRRRRHLRLELVPPLTSVSILILVTGFVLHKSIHVVVLHKSIHVVILDAHRSRREQSRPNLILMMSFSVLNLLLDLANVTCFARAKHLMGFNTIDAQSPEITLKEESMGLQHYDVIGDSDDVPSEYEDQSLNNSVIESYDYHSKIEATVTNGSGLIPMGERACSNEENGEPNSFDIQNEPNMTDEAENVDQSDRVNLNMCSAYTVSSECRRSFLHPFLIFARDIFLSSL